MMNSVYILNHKKSWVSYIIYHISIIIINSFSKNVCLNFWKVFSLGRKKKLKQHFKIIIIVFNYKNGFKY
jgi:hypothetical protein